jgi:hypothetical protein
MKSLSEYGPLLNGEELAIEHDSGRALIHAMQSDDWGRLPYSLIFEATTESGQLVRIAIPYDHTSPAHTVTSRTSKSPTDQTTE